MVIYAPIAIFGPVNEVWTGRGWLKCQGSANTLRNRTGIRRDPQRFDCRSQAEDQTSGAAASLVVGAELLVVDYSVLARRRVTEDLRSENELGRWAISRPWRRFLVGAPAISALGAIAGSPFWGASAVGSVVVATLPVAFLGLVLIRKKIEARSGELVVSTVFRRLSIAYEDVDSFAATFLGVAVFSRDMPAVLCEISAKTIWGRQDHGVRRADEIVQQLAARVAELGATARRSTSAFLTANGGCSGSDACCSPSPSPPSSSWSSCFGACSQHAPVVTNVIADPCRSRSGREVFALV